MFQTHNVPHLAILDPLGFQGVCRTDPRRVKPLLFQLPMQLVGMCPRGQKVQLMSLLELSCIKRFAESIEDCHELPQNTLSFVQQHICFRRSLFKSYLEKASGTFSAGIFSSCASATRRHWGSPWTRKRKCSKRNRKHYTSRPRTRILGPQWSGYWPSWGRRNPRVLRRLGTHKQRCRTGVWFRHGTYRRNVSFHKPWRRLQALFTRHDTASSRQISSGAAYSRLFIYEAAIPGLYSSLPLPQY